MDELETRVLKLLSQGLTVNDIGKKIAADEETLADVIINLEMEGYVALNEKNWILTEKGKEIFNGGKEEFKLLKIEYLHGRINTEEYNKRKKELEERLLFIVPEAASKNEEMVRNIFCTKCGTENKIEYNFCRKCSFKLKKD